MLNHRTIRRIERALKLSTVEGMAYGGVQGTGEHFANPYAVALGASNTQLAVLASGSSFLGALAQSVAPALVGLMGNRKRLVVVFAWISGLVWLPVIAVGYLPGGNVVPWLIACLALYAVVSAVVSPAWGSIMAQVVPDHIRGRYFGRRSRWSTLANMLSFLVAGGLLYLLRDRGLLGFVLVFGMAFLFRMVSVGLLTTLEELPTGPKGGERDGLSAFFRQLWSTNLGRVMLYLFSVNFVVNLAGPFFVPYMLRNLNMNYLVFTILEMASILAALWSVTHWGAAADRAGNRRMLRLAGVLIGLVPLLWLMSTNIIYLGFAQFYSGLAWAGFNLVATNFIYDATNERNRTTFLAYFSAGSAVATSLGALAGGLLIGHLPVFMGSAILTMFLVSGILRLVVAGLFLPRINEVRRVSAIPSVEVFHIMLGGRVVHKPAALGRVHHHFHWRREEP